MHQNTVSPLPSGSGTIASFEGGRGLAALFVALFHFGHDANALSVVRNGYLFVDLFFVISGFVICSAYSTRLETAGDLRSFLIRRFGRLFPLLVFSTALYVLAKNLLVWAKQAAITRGLGGQFERSDFAGYLFPGLGEVVSTLTLTHGMGIFDRLILNPVSWSISTEFYAYVLFAAVCLAFSGAARLAVYVVLSASGLAATIWASLHVHDCLQAGKCFDITYDFGFARCVGSFFLGALTYHFSRLVRLNANELQAVGLTGLVALFFVAEAWPMLVFASPLLFALLVFSVSQDTGFAASMLKSKPFQVLGQRSYSVYMMHPILMIFVEPFARRTQGTVLIAVVVVAYLAILLLVSGWTYKFIEDPLRKWFNRIAGDRRQSRVAMQS
ncbi:acyltransferase [Polaromonas sp.]|uniref:acyltransferase family protein n=1 Tax=Polaromonas sp. TaxID=1869339 RepID=UPI0032654E36